MGVDADLAGHKIERATSPTGPWTEIADIGATDHFEDKTAVQGQDYYYRMRAYDFTYRALGTPSNISPYSQVIGPIRAGKVQGNQVGFNYAGSDSLAGDANNTKKVNAAQTDSGQVYKVYGNIKMMNGVSIQFYSDDGATYKGGVYGDGNGIQVTASGVLQLSGTAVSLSGNFRIGAELGTISTITRRLAVYDLSGNPIGFIPIGT